MVTMLPIELDGRTCISVDVMLPKTHLIAIQAHSGYIMCGALDVNLLNTRLHSRNIIAGRAVGVRTVEELLNAPLEAITDAAASLGITKGMTGKDALCIMYDLTSPWEQG